MRVCIISQYFPPDTGGASTRASNVAETLEKKGHQVTVVTAFPHYPHGIIPSKYRRKILAIESWNQVRVLRVWIPPLPHDGVTKRLVLYLSFTLSALLALPLCRKSRVTWAMSPNYLCVVPATALKLAFRSKTIHDLVDIWPDALIATGYSIPKMALIATGALSRISCLLSDRITTISQSMRTHLQRAIPSFIPVDVIENCVTDPFFEVPPKKPDSDIHLMYLGTLGPSNDFPTMLEAAKKLQGEGFWRFTIAGSGEEAKGIEMSLTAHAMANVDFHAVVIDHDDVPKWLATADALVLPLKRGFGNASLPSKLGEYLASGRPVICVADGELAKLVRENGIALLVSPGDVTGFVDAARQLKNDPFATSRLSLRGREYARTNLSYESFLKKTNNVLELTAGLGRVRRSNGVDMN